MAVQTLFIRSTASSVVTGSASMHKLDTAAGTVDVKTTQVNNGKTLQSWTYVPGTATAITATDPPTTTPQTKGWIYDGSAAGSYANTDWTINLCFSASVAVGTVTYRAQLYVVTATTTAVTKVSQIGTLVSSAAVTPALADTRRVLTITAPGVITLTAGQYLYLEIYLKQTVSSGNSFAHNDVVEDDPTAGTQGDIVTPDFTVASSGITVTPGFGDATLTGFAPAIGLPKTVTPDVGTATLTGFAPTIGLPVTALPGVGSATLTGFAPTIGLPVTVLPDVGGAVLTGFAPTISTASGTATVLPGTGDATLTGFAPTIGLPQTVTPGVGSAVLTGFAPSIGLPVTVTPDVGAAVLTGFAPTVSTTAAGTTVTPDVGDIQLTGFEPTIGLPVTVTSQTGAVVLEGFAPTIDVGTVTPVVVAQAPAGGTRLPTKYEPVNLRRARAAAAKRRLDEERRRLSELKRQQVKVEVQYKAISLTNDPPHLSSNSPPSDRARLLELEIKEYEQRVSLQAARVKEARKANELARREAEDRQSAADEAMRAHEAIQAQSEWQRIENERLQQERDDDEMMQVLLLIHEDA